MEDARLARRHPPPGAGRGDPDAGRLPRTAALSGSTARVARSSGVAKIPPLIFTIPLRPVSSPSWPSTRRRYPAAPRKTTESHHARPFGRLAAALSAHGRGRAFPRPLGPHARKAPHLPHRAEVPQDRRARRLCDRGPEDLGRSRRQDLDVGSGRRNGLPGEAKSGGRHHSIPNSSSLTLCRSRTMPGERQCPIMEERVRLRCARSPRMPPDTWIRTSQSASSKAVAIVVFVAPRPTTDLTPVPSRRIGVVAFRRRIAVAEMLRSLLPLRPPDNAETPHE